MVEFFLFRGGRRDDRVTQTGTISLMALKPLLITRSLSSPTDNVPVVAESSTRASKLPQYTAPSYVAIKCEDDSEAAEIGATPGKYHLVENMTPAEIVAAAVVQ